jgi:hypothetical protein
MQTRFSIPLLFAIIFFIPRAGSAGPPFLTDDPEPLLRRHCEFYIAPQILNAVNQLSLLLPGVEFNEGLTDDVMAHIIVPFILTKQDSQQGMFSLGDVELGLKYRFIEESNLFPQIGIFPHLEIPTGDSSKGAGSGAAQVFIPIWVQKSFGPWTTYGGGGLWHQFSPGIRDFWFFGWEIQRDLSEKLTLGTEFFATTGSFESVRAETGFNVGGSYDFSDAHHLLFSIGREFRGPNTFLMYLAYQLTFKL